MSDEEIITAEDVRRAGYCLKGCRGFFAARPELDYRDFLRNGVPVSKLPADHALVQTVLKVKRENG